MWCNEVVDTLIFTDDPGRKYVLYTFSREAMRFTSSEHDIPVSFKGPLAVASAFGATYVLADTTGRLVIVSALMKAKKKKKKRVQWEFGEVEVPHDLGVVEAMHVNSDYTGK